MAPSNLTYLLDDQLPYLASIDASATKLRA